MATIQNSTVRNIPFYPNLINELKEEHNSLSRYLLQIRNYLEEKKYAEASVIIGKYRSLGLQHSAKENLKLYTYLRLVYIDKRHSIESVKLRSLRKGVDLALITICKFCEEYKDFVKNEQKQESVYAAFCYASQLIIEKMRMEEVDLFPLYLKNLT